MKTTSLQLRQWDGGDIDLSCVCDIGEECGTWIETGAGKGNCCMGLRAAAHRHVEMYRVGLCNMAQAKKRLLTLAGFLGGVPVSWLPNCRYSQLQGTGVVACTKPDCQYNPGPCSKRCTENVK